MFNIERNVPPKRSATLEKDEQVTEIPYQVRPGQQTVRRRRAEMLDSLTKAQMGKETPKIEVKNIEDMIITTLNRKGL